MNRSRCVFRDLLWGVLLSVCFGEGVAEACASCACGDPTLTQIGMEQAFAGRLRLSFQGQGRVDAFGRGDAHQRLQALRLLVSGSWSPSRFSTLYVSVPLVARRLRSANLSEERALGLGDVELRVRGTFWRDRAFRPGHLIGGWGGLRLPTAPRMRIEGVPLSENAQPGTGSWVPLAGVWYAHFAYPWLAYGSVAVEVPLGGWSRTDNVPQLLVTLTAQRHLGIDLAVRLAGEWRWTGRERLDGELDRDSGGWVLFATPALLWSFAQDGSAQCSVRWPVVNALRGGHREGPTVMLGVSFDFDLGETG